MPYTSNNYINSCKKIHHNKNCYSQNTNFSNDLGLFDTPSHSTCSNNNPSNINGQVNRYTNNYSISGDDYNIEKSNYQDNYYNRYNHYYIDENGYLCDYISSDIVYQGTSNY